jgi:tripartite-type tricarboxylate transporter receptor subunit TctC
VQKRLEDLTMQVRSDSTPESTAQWLQGEMAKWEPIIRDAGIKSD